MSKTNERGYVSGHKASAWKFRLDASLCSDKQSWNSDNITCECKELIDKGMCDNGFLICVNVKNLVMLVNTWIMWIVNAEKG